MSGGTATQCRIFTNMTGGTATQCRIFTSMTGGTTTDCKIGYGYNNNANGTMSGGEAKITDPRAEVKRAEYQRNLSRSPAKEREESLQIR